MLRAAIAALHVVARRFDRAAELAENVDLPSGIEADNVGDLRHADAILGGDEGGAEARPRARSLGVPQPPPALASSERQRRADEDGLLRARLLQAIERDLQSGARGNGALDEQIRLAIMQRAPPSGGIDGAAVALCERRRGKSLRHGRFRRLIVRADGAAGKAAANRDRDENRA